MRLSTGNWRLTSVVLAIACGVFGSAATSATAAAAAPKAAAQVALPALDVSGTVDRQSATSGETVTVTVTIENIGTATARHIRETNHGSAGDFAAPGDPTGWNGIVWSQANGGLDRTFDLNAGDSTTVTYTGVIDDWAARQGRAAVIWLFQPDGNVAEPTGGRDPRLSLTVPVAGTAGTDVQGTVCRGAQFEVLVCQMYPGGAAIGIAGVKVSLLDPGAHDTVVSEATTDGSGHYVIHEVPAGQQTFRFVAPDGWELSQTQFSIQVTSGNNNRLDTAGKWVGAGPAPSPEPASNSDSTDGPSAPGAGLPGDDPTASAGGTTGDSDHAPGTATGLVAAVGGPGLLSVYVVLALLLVAGVGSTLHRRRRPSGAGRPRGPYGRALDRTGAAGRGRGGDVTRASDATTETTRASDVTLVSDRRGPR